MEAAQRRTQSLQQHLVPNPTSKVGDRPSVVEKKKKTSEDERNEFMAIWNVIFSEIQRDLPRFGLTPQARDWITSLMDNTIPGGKMNRGLTVLHSLELLVENRTLTRAEAFKAHVLGWCIEILQAFFLVADDIMDQSVSRRGQPCWYRRPHPMGSGPNDTIGNIAINDAFILEAIIYRILKKHFSTEPYYVDLLNLFHDTTYQTEIGQLLDLISNLPGGKVDLSLFTLENYKLIVKYKTAYYSFYLPVALAMVLVGIRSEPTFTVAEDILIPMGEYFQIQDDYLDCYGDPKVIGKVGRDIEENKCSWLIVQALRHATPEQKKVLEKHYGRDNAADVAKVKAVYQEMNIPKIFKQYEEESYAHLTKMIDGVLNMPKEVFLDLLARIYKRNM
eukprot:TRINITY_DN2534_c0_g1_i1.p2 TRINITY_DN2534_c0_g1~~TRINITY_DN2534_c0_g1_i1.p2  ORF type:complete len:407 (+),score=118.85 TRINITY_DN2534_c0_g1_i1:54-1223(+)